MANSDDQTSQSDAWYLVWLRNLGIAVFALASVIALALLWRQGAGTLQKFWLIVGWLVAFGAVALSFLTTVRARGNPQAVIPATVIFDAVSFTVSGLVIVSFGSVADPLRWSAAMIWSFACLALGALTGFIFGIPRSRTGRTGPTPTRTSAGNGNAPGQPPSAAQQGAGNASVPAAGAAAQSAVGAAPGSNGQAAGNGGPGDNQTDNGDSGQNGGASSSSGAGDESPIEQISDWLTKIIVGLGLANLKDLPHQLDLWAQYVAGSIGPSPGSPATATAAVQWGPSFALGLIIYFLILGFLSCYILTQMFLLNFINRMRSTS